MQTCERSSALRAQDLIASDLNYLQSCSAVSSLAECEPLSLAGQMHACRAQFAPHVALSLERTIARLNVFWLTVIAQLWSYCPYLPQTFALLWRCNDYVAHRSGENTYEITRAGSHGTPEIGKTKFVVSLEIESGKYVCSAGCGKAIYKGKACVHIVKVSMLC